MPRSSKNTQPVSHSSANATQTAKPGSPTSFLFTQNKPTGQEILPDKKKSAKSSRTAPKKSAKTSRTAPKKSAGNARRTSSNKKN